MDIKLSLPQDITQQFIDASPDVILVVDGAGRFVQANKHALALLQYSADELLSLPVEKLLPEHLRHGHMDLRSHAYKTSLPRHLDNERELVVLTRTNETIPVDISIAYVTYGDERFAVVTLRDNRMRNERDREINYIREMLNVAQSIAQVGSWDWDLINDQLYWSDETYRILGLDSINDALTFDKFISLIYPADKELFATSINEAIIFDKPFDLEFHIVRPDGEQRVIKGRGKVIKNRQSKPVRMTATVYDVTDFKAAQFELAISDNVFRHTSEGIIVTDADNKIIKVNKAFTTITQYSEQDVLHLQPHDILQSGKHDAAFYDEMWRSLREYDYWAGEIWDRKKDGELFASRHNITAVRDKNGDVLQYISIFSDITEKKVSEENIRQLAHFDQLTGLHNRIIFKDRLEHAINRAQRAKTKVALLFIDLDRFKYVNDNLGHDAGDELLIQVARKFKGIIRKQDTVARLGGDEFTIILEDIHEATDAAIVADNIIKSLVTPFDIKGCDVVIGSSIGISIFPDNSSLPEELVKNADMAMYFAKESGKNQFQYYTQALAERSTQHFYLESRLRKAIDNNELELYYQPQVSTQSGKVTGAEALIRWNDPERGLVSPSAFIPIAEDSGLIDRIGLWVLRTACAQAQKWITDIDETFTISVNLSSKQLGGDVLFDNITAIIDSSGIQPSNLELEVTESAVMDNPDVGIELLKRLRGLGIAISLDDFGTGFSSLSYLKRLPITRVKIDRSFILDAPTNKDDAMIVNAIIMMAKSLELDVIAEGVEDQQHVDYLVSQGCENFQGYYFGHPVSAAEFERLLMAKVWLNGAKNKL